MTAAGLESAAPGAKIRLFNSLGRQVTDFHPATPGQVRMYSCGPTVYSDPHLGNMRAYVFSDTLRRMLEWKGFAITQVVNITDVGHAVGDGDEGEDKVEVAARAEQRSVREVTDHYTAMFMADMEALNVLRAHEYPRASDYVPKMIDFAVKLDAGGHTYQIASGLYFDTTTSPGYGRLALIPQEGQQAGKRVSADEKRSPADFAIWRADPVGQRRIMRWDSPWGPGVPGWHLECSVMSIDLLGPHFDIHTGGVDHRELHHVNEIAQSEAFLDDGHDWVRLWMHNEFLLSGGAKLSKSAGRMPTIRDLAAAGVPPLAFRYFLLTAHYASQLELTDDGLEAAVSALRRLRGRAERLPPVPAAATLAGARGLVSAAGAVKLEQIDAAASEDLNTPRVLAEVQAALRDPVLPDNDKAVLVAVADQLLGLRLADPPEEPAPAGRVVDEAAVEELVQAREQARKARDWAEADRLRDELAVIGVAVADTPEGPRWSLA